jgi:hypothetical protein
MTNLSTCFYSSSMVGLDGVEGEREREREMESMRVSRVEN